MSREIESAIMFYKCGVCKKWFVTSPTPKGSLMECPRTHEDEKQLEFGQTYNINGTDIDFMPLPRGNHEVAGVKPCTPISGT